MTTRANTAIRSTARFAGGLYLLLLPFGVFSFVYVSSVLLVRGDPAATSHNILASERLFRSSTVSHLISQIIVVFVVLALYRLLEPVNKNRAVRMVVFALLGVPIAFLNEAHNLAVLWLLRGADAGAFTAAQLQAQAMLFLDMGSSGILVAQVFWGMWMFPLGFLVLRSGFLPKPLGITALIAGAGYLFDSGTRLLYPSLPTISQFTVLAELMLPMWLLIMGVRVERWQQVAGSK